MNESTACFGVLVNNKGEVVDAGPAQSTRDGFLVAPSGVRDIQETIDLSHLVYAASISIFITASPSRCCWVWTPYGWKCMPC
jgi:hypothetical protein